ncbi:DDB1- and CUL4-associated factor 4-like, partial [Amphiura filiformis]|uniref:DDB1- and CUL4-associated factor 4-like n=1 Tax=Amphiura filiformis TaxID=82378 RepID=UPI003B213835
NNTHLPGFYYDPEKKKYFRLLSGNNNYNPLTKDGLQLKAAEETRVKMIQGKEPTPPKPAAQTAANSRTMMLLQRNREQGQLTYQQFARFAHEHCVTMLPMQPTHELTPFPDTYFNGEAGSIQFLKVDQHQDRVLMVIHDSFLSRIWQGSVNRDDNNNDAVAIDNWGTVNVLGTRSNKITNVEWATSDRDDGLQVLYTVSGGQTSSAQLFKIYRDSSGRWKKEFVFSTESMEKMCWTCAWNHNPLMQPQISIGSSRCAVIFDIATANRKELYSGHSDVLAQVYSRHRPILFNGTRRGEILGCDLRVDLREPQLYREGKTVACKLKHRVCVCSLKLLKDENYILASDISGKIRLWDMRMGRHIYSYQGLANKHSQLTVSVDSSETLVYGAGIDKCTKFWSLQDGRLLHTVPSPLPMSTDGLPVPAYSRQWHGGATPGLILGMERQLFWYSLAL